MNDQEMLQLASLVAGYEVDAPRYDEKGQFLGLALSDGTLFNSKEDDRDAFKLAVKIGIVENTKMIVAVDKIKNGEVKIPIGYCGYNIFIDQLCEDREAEYRLAITRAAAEIGLIIKEQKK